MTKSPDIETYGDDVLHDDGVVGEKDGTANDARDMQRMGKQQQLRVSSWEGPRIVSKAPSVIKSLTDFSAQFWLSVNLRVCDDPDEHMGEPARVWKYPL